MKPERILRFFDQQLFLSMALVMVIALVGFDKYTSWQENEQKGERIDKLVVQLQDSQKQLAATQQAMVEQDRAAGVERRELLAGQKDLRMKYNGLLDWLQSQGIYLPPEILSQGRSSHHASSGDGKHGGSGKASSPSSSGGKSSSSPSSGGGSGKSSGGKSGSKSHGKKGGKSSTHKHHGSKK